MVQIPFAFCDVIETVHPPAVTPLYARLHMLAVKRSRPSGGYTMTPQILVVDDDPALNILVAHLLRDEGYEIQTAAHGREALQSIDGGCPDAVVLDLEMPVMDGRAFYHRLRAARCMTPVIILSAHGAKQAQRELGADAALDKPFDPDEFVTAVHELLE